MPKPSPRIPPLEYQQEIKRRFTVNEKSQTGLDRDGHELCLKPIESKYGYCKGRKYKRHNKARYYRVSVTVNGKEKLFRVHNIVIWLTFELSRGMKIWVASRVRNSALSVHSAAEKPVRSTISAGVFAR